MEILKNKIVFITGATSGIGRACAYAFAKENASLVLCGRRVSLLKSIKNDIEFKFGVDVYTFQLDVRFKNDVEKSIRQIPEKLKNIDILINNAGLGRGFAKFYEDDTQNWDEMIDTNIKGLLYVTRAVVPGMVERKSGHIINLGSLAGHEAYPNGSVYCGTKHAVDAITKSLRMDVVDKNIRVSTVDPGMVETEFSVVRFKGDEERAKNVYKGYTPLKAEDIADAVLFTASRPAHVNIAEIIIYPTAQASATILHKQL
ncbi:MAG: SDR family oxidoreductase [Bacteroidetes bacterium]|nr:SDR family oxidoreductase [Bacteroidota bacterium]MBU2508445.1 SDR family oxidoreductase [Bacteroidota bacterium]